MANGEPVLLSLHLKATMMKVRSWEHPVETSAIEIIPVIYWGAAVGKPRFEVSDPILFGHCVKAYFAPVFEKHAATSPSSGFLQEQYASFSFSDACVHCKADSSNLAQAGGDARVSAPVDQLCAALRTFPASRLSRARARQTFVRSRAASDRCTAGRGAATARRRRFRRSPRREPCGGRCAAQLPCSVARGRARGAQVRNGRGGGEVAERRSAAKRVNLLGRRF